MTKETQLVSGRVSDHFCTLHFLKIDFKEEGRGEERDRNINNLY